MSVIGIAFLDTQLSLCRIFVMPIVLPKPDGFEAQYKRRRTVPHDGAEDNEWSDVERRHPLTSYIVI